MSDGPVELPPQLLQHKRMAELESESEQLKRQLQQVQLERDAAVKKLLELEQALLSVLPGTSSEPLLRRVQALAHAQSEKVEAAARDEDAQRALEQRRARWRQLVAEVTPLAGPLGDETAQAAMALVATCADHLLREEEQRFGARPSE